MKTIFDNRKANFNYFIKNEYIAGIVLTGCEIKSIRDRSVNISDAYCVFTNGELFIKNMYISEYKHAGYEKCEVVRDRKLLLTKHELRKLSQNVKTKGNTIIPLSVFINDRGLCKIKLALASGKHSYDKSQSIKERDLDRELKRSIF